MAAYSAFDHTRWLTAVSASQLRRGPSIDVMPRVARVLSLAMLVVLLATTLPAAGAVAAEASDDASDIVLALDFSGSILDDEAIRNDFADALDDIAARVEETGDRLVAGDATVSIVRFATRARNLGDCTGLELRENEAAVAALAGCLRRVAEGYRNGTRQSLTNAIGRDTNYVAAMEQAAGHLPADSARPALIFFTDGRHDVAGVPEREVAQARDRLFGERSPFALLPVGMGVDPNDRPRLEAGLADLRISRDFERCDGGPLEWPGVVFDSAEAAGQAVALALQDVSCTFTVEPTPTPAPTPAAVPVDGVRARPGDSVVEVSWRAPADIQTLPVDDYLVRCAPTAGGDAVELTVASTETTVVVEGLANGVEYGCQVAAVRGGVAGESLAADPATPFGPPPAPSKPLVEALNTGARLAVAMPAAAPVDGFTYECSSDGGATWAVQREVVGASTIIDVAGLTNGIEYVCRLFAANASGISEASPLTDLFRPCGGLIDCNPFVLPLLGVFVFLILAYLVFALFRWYGGRQVYVTAQVDQFRSVSLGRGPRVGMKFVKRGPSNALAGIVRADGRDADVRIRYAGGEKFEVRSGKVRVKTPYGRQVQVRDRDGATHNVVFRAFDEPPSA